jgi:type IV pilus assembly protein PilX
MIRLLISSSPSQTAVFGAAFQMKNRSLRFQSGISLLMSLLMLLALAVTTVAGIQVAGLQERSAANARDRTGAFNAAESALRDAENYLSTETNPPIFVDPSATAEFTAGHFALNSMAVTGLTRLPTLALTDGSSEDLWLDPVAITFLKTNGIKYGDLTGKPALTGVPTQPRFIIEQVNATDRARMRTYRLTAVAEGRDSALVVLQSYYTPPQFTVTP